MTEAIVSSAAICKLISMDISTLEPAFGSDRYTEETVLNDYLRAKQTDGSFVYADLGFCTGTDSQNNEVDTDASRYVSGYLATLYLSELAARKDLGLGSSITTNGDVVTTDSLQHYSQ